MFQLIHIGDLHLAPGKPERLAALDRIIDEGLRLQRLGAWLIPGDLNHARMSIDDRNALAERLQRMATVAPVVICQGNHDLPGDLDVFGRLQAQHVIHVITRPASLSLPMAVGTANLQLCVLPYPTRAGLIASGTTAATTLETAHQALSDIMRDFARVCADARQHDQPAAFVGHVNVGGAVASCGQPQIGAEIELDGAQFAILGSDVYKGLNHIHAHQQIHGAWYPGSVTPCDWGEIEPKGYLLVTYREAPVATDGDPAEWFYDVAFVPLPVAPRYHVEGKLTRDGFDWRVTKGSGGPDIDAPATWAGCEVRVRATCAGSERSVVNLDLARAPFADAARCDVELVAIPDRGLRAPAVAIAQTLADKLVAWSEANGQEARLSALARLGQLEHADPTTLLADLTRELQALESSTPAKADREVAA